MTEQKTADEEKCPATALLRFFGSAEFVSV